MSHNSKIQDTETHFIIDPATRTIANTSSGNNIIVQYDHNSERFTFEVPRYIDGHDMSESTEVRVNYINSASTGLTKTPGIYICDDLAIDPDDENLVTFSWLLSSAATQYIGFLYFSIQFVCLNGETVEYVWNTGIYKDIVIIESINNGEGAMNNNVDALIAYRNAIIEEVSAGITNGRIGYVNILANKWVGDSSPYSQVVEIEGVTENTQVDLTPSVEQLAIFHEKDLAFVTANTGGTVTVYAVGQKPANDYTIQVTMKEVVTESETIIGITVGTPMSVRKIEQEMTHVTDKTNPHKVTIGQIGAAPAGYGLGGNAQFIDNWDNAKESGFYYSQGNTPDGDIWAGYSIKNGYYGNIIQRIFTRSARPYECTRTLMDDTWNEWEWVNPPMIVGVEYRTTERFDGHPVYTMAVNYGQLPSNTSKTVDISMNGSYSYIQMVGISGQFVSVENQNVTGDLMSADFIKAHWVQAVNGNALIFGLTTNLEDASKYYGFPIIKYVKY